MGKAICSIKKNDTEILTILSFTFILNVDIFFSISFHIFCLIIMPGTKINFIYFLNRQDKKNRGGMKILIEKSRKRFYRVLLESIQEFYITL